MTVEDRVRKVMAAHTALPLDQTPLAGRLAEDFDFDSLDKVEFGMELEEEFQIGLPDNAIDDAVTLQDLVDALKAEGVS